MNTLKISKRLEAAASFSRRGARFADVGTDHAYLPIALCLDSKIRGAVASDINKGPIEKARENIEKYRKGSCRVIFIPKRNAVPLSGPGDWYVLYTNDAPDPRATSVSILGAPRRSP